MKNSKRISKSYYFYTIGINLKGSIPRANTRPSEVHLTKGLFQGFIPMYNSMG